MIKREGHYILTVEDWNNIIKYFLLAPKTVAIKEAPNLTFTEYRVYDIYSNKVLFSFYDHDGKIRIPGNGKLIAYEIDISQVFAKNPDAPAQELLDAIKINTHSRKTFAERVSEKLPRRNNRQTTSKKQFAKIPSYIMRRRRDKLSFIFFLSGKFS